MGWIVALFMIGLLVFIAREGAHYATICELKDKNDVMDEAFDDACRRIGELANEASYYKVQARALHSADPNRSPMTLTECHQINQHRKTNPTLPPLCENCGQVATRSEKQSTKLSGVQQRPLLSDAQSYCLTAIASTVTACIALVGNDS